jgi:hypothetical protein
MEPLSVPKQESLYDAIVGLCQDAGFCTEHTYDSIHQVVESIGTGDGEDDEDIEPTATQKARVTADSVMVDITEKPKIHIACISHDHGNGFFTAATEDKLYERVALEFVILYLDELPEEARQDVVRELEAQNYRHAVHIYFEYHESESLEVGTGD